MQKSKKNAVGLVEAWLLLSGELGRRSNGLNAKTAASYSPVTIQIRDWKIALFGLKNGYWSDRLLKHLAVTATYQSIHYNVFFILS
jgi:hypothetical protein